MTNPCDASSLVERLGISTKDALQMLVVERRAGENGGSGLADFMAWVDHVTNPSSPFAKNSQRRYLGESKRFVLWLYLVRGCRLQDVNEKIIVGYQTHLLSSQFASSTGIGSASSHERSGVSLSSSEHSLRVLRQFFSFLTERGTAEINPIKAIPKSRFRPAE